jgi:DNA-binding LacI/PurR family transcriptional regulator
VNIAILCQNDLAADFAVYTRLVVASVRKVFMKKNWHSFIYDQFPRIVDSASSVEKFVHDQFIKDIAAGDVNAYVEIALGDSKDDEREKLSIPFVRISQVRQFTDILFDYKKFIVDTIERSVDMGRKRICVLGVFEDVEIVLGIREAVERFGVPFPETPSLGGGCFPPSAPGVESALFEEFSKLLAEWRSKDEFPETLIVADDMAMRTVALVLLKEGVSIPDDLLVISQANEGVEMFYGIPVLKYVFPTLEMSRTAVDILEGRMRGTLTAETPLCVGGGFAENGIQ